MTSNELTELRAEHAAKTIECADRVTVAEARSSTRRRALVSGAAMIAGATLAPACAALPAILATIGSGANWLTQALGQARTAADDLVGIAGPDLQRVNQALDVAQQAARALDELGGLGVVVSEGNALLARLKAASTYAALVALLDALRGHPAARTLGSEPPAALPTADEACTELAR